MQIVLLAAGVISIYPVEQAGTGIVILLLTLLNAVLGLNQEGKAAAAVAALAKMMIVKARVLRDGALTQIPAEGAGAGRRRRDRGRRPCPGRRAGARCRDARGRGGRPDGREPPGEQGRGAGRGARRAARGPDRHGLHEHQRHAGHRRVRRHRHGDGDRGRAHLGDAPAPGRVEVAADRPAGEADQAARHDRRDRARRLGRDQHGAGPDVHRGLHRRGGVRDRRDPDRPSGRRHDDPVARHAPARRRRRDRQAPALDGDARRHVGDLLGQDRDADAQPDDGRRADDPRPPLRGLRDGLLDRGADQARRRRARGAAGAVRPPARARLRRGPHRDRGDDRRPDRGRAGRPGREGRPRSHDDARALSARGRAAVRHRLQADGHVPPDDGRVGPRGDPLLRQGRARTSSWPARRRICDPTLATAEADDGVPCALPRGERAARQEGPAGDGHRTQGLRARRLPAGRRPAGAHGRAHAAGARRDRRPSAAGGEGGDRQGARGRDPGAHDHRRPRDHRRGDRRRARHRGPGDHGRAVRGAQRRAGRHRDRRDRRDRARDPRAEGPARRHPQAQGPRRRR